MPLLKCPVCGGDVSDAASACPHCGHPRYNAPAPPPPPVPPTQSGTPVAFFVTLIGIVLVMVSLVAAAAWYRYHRFEEAAHPSAGPELVEWDTVSTGTAATDTGATDGLPQDVPIPDVLPPDSTYELSMVEEQPRIANMEQVQAALARNYPPLLRDAGVTGQVAVRMRVEADGTVDPQSITVEQSTHDAFSTAAVRVAEIIRFRPAKVHEKPVPVWVTLPITFQLAG